MKRHRPDLERQSDERSPAPAQKKGEVERAPKFWTSGAMRVVPLAP